MTPRIKASSLAWLEKILRPNPRALNSPRSHPLSAVGLTYPDSEIAIDSDEIQFEELIGSGSFGAVWRGVFREGVVAVKQCKVGDQGDAAMLLEESRYLQKLRHPRLVSFLGCVNKPPHILLLVEFMPGGSLYEFLFNNGVRRAGGQQLRRDTKERSATATSLKFSERASMAWQVAEGLAFLHSLSVVHRDLKSMNVVLDLELNCKICDFGLTVTLERSHLTVAAMQGSPRYMAPEQFESTARITEKVDMWQMGCVMLELFCGQIPFFHARGVQQIATELLLKRRAPPVPHEADPRARVLILSCLRLSAKLRPSGRALEEALVVMKGPKAKEEPTSSHRDKETHPFEGDR